jgi:hypothetical protein
VRAIVVALALAGCEEPLGPMSPGTVDAITKTTGDATGFERSGQYWVWIDPVECPCNQEESQPGGRPSINGLAALSLCQILEQNSPEDPRLFDVLATDGVVTLESHELNWAPVLVGPLYEGGRFSAGSVTSIATLGAGGRIVTRIDGDFDSNNGGQEFEASLLNRIAGKTTIETQAFDVDCTEELELTGMFP